MNTKDTAVKIRIFLIEKNNSRKATKKDLNFFWRNNKKQSLTGFHLFDRYRPKWFNFDQNI